ncbi:javelin-like isoform X2 [Lycorma delicatula]|uniref:javelin-like isoform X2 n=1 Tax=Lycorma delicatula TaxID=130591 RepID=UPI003F511702
MNREFFPRCSSVNYTARGMDCVSTVSRRRTNSEEEDEEEEDRALDDTIVATSTQAAAPFQYLISEQAKSIVALQELQNEVGALLEFRDLVMETFPHLRQKMSSSTAPSTPRQMSHIPVATSLQGKSRDWEPGIRVRRKLHQHSREQDTSVPSMGPRSRSNSHGKAPKSSSGETGNSGTSSTGSSAVQDSGFCTESKEHCSSSTSTTTTTATTAARKAEGDTEQEVEDELWNLLDLIHIKGTKLRLEVEYLQEKFEKCDRKRGGIRRSKSLEYVKKNHEPPRTKCDLMLEQELRGLKQERDLLLDRVADMEAENLANLAQTNQLLAEVGALSAEKRDLEEQLRAAISAKSDLNSRIHDLHLQFINRTGQEGKNGKSINPAVKTNNILKLSPSKAVGSSQIVVGGGSCFTPVKRSDNVSGCQELGQTVNSDVCSGESSLPKSELGVDYLKEEDGYRIEDRRPSDPVSQRLACSDTPKIATASEKDVFSDNKVASDSAPSGANETVHRLNQSPISDDAKARLCKKNIGKLGVLDGIVSSPSDKIKGAKDILPDKKKTAAILTQFNAIELQRHLLMTTYENQVATSRLEKLSRLKTDLSHQLDKFKEENDDLRFQLEEKSIELEGTRARIRLLERLQSAKYSSDLSESVVNHSHTLLPPSHESTPNPILPHIALPIALDDTAIHHSSSTESAHHDEDLTIEKRSESPRKRPPSKIPLKSYSAPKPPTGRTKPLTQKSVKESISLGRSRDANKSKDISMYSRSRESSVGGKTGSRESLKEPSSSIGRRMRKHSTQDGSFSSTGSSHSVRNNQTPSLASKKTQSSSSRERISTQDQNEQKSNAENICSPSTERNRSEKTEEFLDSLDNYNYRHEQSLNSNYRFLNKFDNQELDRSMSSVVPSRAWRSVTNQPAEYYDSIDYSASGFNQVNVNSASEREALAEFDSLEPSCSDCGDLV